MVKGKIELAQGEDTTPCHLDPILVRTPTWNTTEAGTSFSVLMIRPVEVILRYQLFLYMICCVLKGCQEFVEIFLVQKNLALLVEMPQLRKFLPTLCDDEVVVFGTRSLHIKKVSSFTRFHFLRIDLTIFSVFFQDTLVFIFLPTNDDVLEE